MKPWQITYAGVTFTDEDLIGSDLVDAQILVNDGWASIDVTKSPLHCFSVTAAYVARVKGLEFTDVADAIKALPLSQLPIPEPREMERATERTEVPFSPHGAVSYSSDLVA